MELIFIVAKFFEVLVINPVWWFCGWVAGWFYPEYTNEYLMIAWLVCACLTFALVATLVVVGQHA